tara:strand:- start:44195 stop:44488 length:294 start_codon:yes stop_codon:yes gene_type:complete
MSITDQEIMKIANLAKLELSDKAETDNLKIKLNESLSIFDELQHVNTDNITPMAHPIENTFQMQRPDEITESANKSELQLIAPDIEAGLYIVPTVIE